MQILGSRLTNPLQLPCHFLPHTSWYSRVPLKSPCPQWSDKNNIWMLQDSKFNALIWVARSITVWGRSNWNSRLVMVGGTGLATVLIGKVTHCWYEVRAASTFVSIEAVDIWRVLNESPASLAAGSSVEIIITVLWFKTWTFFQGVLTTLKKNKFIILKMIDFKILIGSFERL